MFVISSQSGLSPFVERTLIQIQIFSMFRECIEIKVYQFFRLYSRFCSRIPRVPFLKRATAQDFHKFVVDGVRKYKDCFARWSIRQCAYNTSLFQDVTVSLE